MIAFGVEDPVVAAAVAYRGAFRNRGGGDTGQSANAFQEVPLEAWALLKRQVEGTGVHIGDEHAILLEARIARHQVLEDARKEQSAREQDDRKGNLRGDQNALQAETFAASGHAAPTGTDPPSTCASDTFPAAVSLAAEICFDLRSAYPAGWGSEAIRRDQSLVIWIRLESRGGNMAISINWMWLESKGGNMTTAHIISVRVISLFFYQANSVRNGQPQSSHRLAAASQLKRPTSSTPSADGHLNVC
jgi:hypothetical protein